MSSERMSPQRVSDRHVLAGAIPSADGTRLLLAQRDRPADVAGLWELPGGKAEPGETDRQALVRELIEELGVHVAVGDRLRESVTLPGGSTSARPGLVLIAYWASIDSGVPVAHDHRALRWVDAAELAELGAAGELVPADTVWLPELLAALRATPGG